MILSFLKLFQISNLVAVDNVDSLLTWELTTYISPILLGAFHNQKNNVMFLLTNLSNSRYYIEYCNFLELLMHVSCIDGC